MFDLSLGELGLIALVALLVLGPERLPKAARTVGFYVRKARQSWFSVRAEFERELAADELKRSLKLDEMHATLEQTAKDVRGEFDQASAGVKAATLPAAVTPSIASSELNDDDGLSDEERARQLEALPPEPEVATEDSSDQALGDDLDCKPRDAAAQASPDFVANGTRSEADIAAPDQDRARPDANEPAR